MKEKRRRYRENAKFAVFSHIGGALLAVVLSGIVSTLISSYYQYTAEINNIDLYSDDIEVMKITLAVSLLSTLINLPVAFSAARFYLVISRKSPLEPATLKEFFAPFTSPAFLIKGSVLMLITSILTLLGAFVFVFPVYFMYCMSVFIISDDPSISPIKALTLSRRMMKGSKWMAFMTTLPILALYVVLTFIFSSLYFLSFFITSIVESVFFVTLAMIYEDLRRNSHS